MQKKGDNKRLRSADTACSSLYTPQNHRGTANSTMLMAGDLGVGLGTLLWGISIQFCGFHVSIALSGLAVILSGVLSLLFYCRCKP